MDESEQQQELDGGPMTDPTMNLIRHIAGKALVESDEVDTEKLTTEQIETALWAASAEISLGTYITHPKNRDIDWGLEGDEE